MILQNSSTSFSAMLGRFPEEVVVDPGLVRQATCPPKACLIVIDDDPTGSQSVSNIPVITSWQEEDFDWAFAQGLGAVFVLINSRALSPEEAKTLNKQVVANGLSAATKNGITVSFLSRGDSTLRGHFPDETDAITQAWLETGHSPNRSTILVPAFPTAGRVTIGGVHYLRNAERLLEVGQSEFASDKSFGFSKSRLAEYIEEKTFGKVKAKDVFELDLDIIRTSPEAISDILSGLPSGSYVVADAVSINDLRMLSLGIAGAQSNGETFLLRTGPAFVGAWLGQPAVQELQATEIATEGSHFLKGGLIVVGSHVDLTNRQLFELETKFPKIEQFEVTPELLLGLAADTGKLEEITQRLILALESNNVVLRTSRVVVAGATPDESLEISKNISNAVAQIVNRLVSQRPPAFIVAKGGITSNDVASKGLEISRALVLGPLLPGLVSMWKPKSGIAQGMPFVVFPGNVGDEFALSQVVEKLSNHAEGRAQIDD